MATRFLIAGVLTRGFCYGAKKSSEVCLPWLELLSQFTQTKLPTLHEWRDELWRSYLARIKREGHKLNHLLTASRDHPTRQGMIAHIHP